MAVYDRWHTTKPALYSIATREPVRCREHKLFASVDHGQGDRWQVRWRDPELPPGKQQRKANFAKKDGKDPGIHADAYDKKIQGELTAGTYIAPSKGRTKVREYSEKWRTSLLHRDSTAERMERVFRLHVDPYLGHIPINQVKASHLRNWVKSRADDLAPSTLAVAYSNIASMFAAAVIDGDISVSPCAGIRLPEGEKHPHFIPTPDQVHALAENLPARHSAIAYLAAGCGLRGGEIFGLELGAVDFLRREVDISQQLTVIAGRTPYLARTKTRTSARTVELPQVTAAALTEHLKRFEPVEVEIMDETDPRNPKFRTVRLLFTTAQLNPIHRATWSHLWAPAREAAGIPKGIGLHCLRHYFATLLIHEGASVKTVQMALGHSTPMVTLNEYVGEWPEAHERTRTIVDGSLGRVPRMCPPAAKVAGGRR